MENISYIRKPQIISLIIWLQTVFNSAYHKQNASIMDKHIKHQGYECIYMAHIFIAFNHVKRKLENSQIPPINYQCKNIHATCIINHFAQKEISLISTRNVFPLNLFPFILAKTIGYSRSTFASIPDNFFWCVQSFDSASAKWWSCLNKSPPPLRQKMVILKGYLARRRHKYLKAYLNTIIK